MVDSAAVGRLLNSLNPHQLAAARVGQGMASVIGCPGGGKTRVLEARIARMVVEGLPPNYILAMTFTKAAAKVLTDRLEALGIFGVKTGTIHSICYEALKEHMPEVGMLKVQESDWTFTLQVKQAIAEMQRTRILPQGTISLASVLTFIGGCKACGPAWVFGDPFGANADATVWQLKVGSKLDKKMGISPRSAVDLYREVEMRRAAQRLLTYDDMMLWAWLLLATNDDARSDLCYRYSAVLVDEAQDSTPLQWDISRLLAGMRSELVDWVHAGETGNLMVAGDTSQSLFSWRWAVPEALQEFSMRKDVGLYPLPVNYRSRPEICDVATRLVIDQDWHLAGEIHPPDERGSSTVDGLREAFTFSHYPDAAAEAAAVVERAVALATPYGHYKEVIILARLAGFLHLVELECLRRHIPYVKYASGGFIDAREVADLLAYLRVGIGADPEGRWMIHTIKVPYKYVSRVALAEAQRLAGMRGISVLKALLLDGSLSQRVRRRLLDLERLILRIREDADEAPPAEVLKYVVAETSYLEHLRGESGDVAPDSSKEMLVTELTWIAEKFATIRDFLTHVDYLSASVKNQRKQYRADPEDADTNGKHLTLSTIHRAKGREFDHVLLGDVVQGRFPWSLAHSPEEELRLLFTAITRARLSVSVSYTKRPGTRIESTLLRSLRKSVEAVTTSCNKPGILATG